MEEGVERYSSGLPKRSKEVVDVGARDTFDVDGADETAAISNRQVMNPRGGDDAVQGS